ncbi:MAG: transglutaminase domain-containing protein [Vicinamibacterales bacterium]|nr:transglutaminase domain-containing protein [Vicinamibacterales bacterium]
MALNYMGRSRWFLAGFLLSAIVLGSVSVHYRVPLWDAPLAVTKLAAAPVLGYLRDRDTHDAERQRAGYWVGLEPLPREDGVGSWRRIEKAEPGFRVIDASGARTLPAAVPFVYEAADEPYLRQLVETHGLRHVIAGAEDEYDAMLRLGAWVGGLFDHGADALGRQQARIAPVDVIRLGVQGKKFWCEVAARLTVHAATAVGWQARLVTGSKTGYTWDHAVAELWSNQHRKWFVIDADFNVVYETDGVPLSAFELSRRGPALQQEHRLRVRAIAPPKPSLPIIDLVPYYEYVHVDLRNDWNSRFLGIGSPEGGDRNTWWTARPTLGPVITAKVREDRAERFDWPVNAVSMHALGVTRATGGRPVLRVGLAAYSPSFGRFETALDEGAWVAVPGSDARVPLSPGRHVLKARVMTDAGFPGPAYSVTFDVGPHPS